MLIIPCQCAQRGWCYWQGLLYFTGIVYCHDVHSWTVIFKVLLSRLPHIQSLIFPEKLFYFCSIQDTFGNAARYPGAFSWALVTAIAKMYVQYAEIYFVQILSEYICSPGP